MEVVRTPGLTEFFFNGVLVADIEDGEDAAPGLPWFGYADLFASVAGGDTSQIYSGEQFSPKTASFGLFDNVRVYNTAVPEPAASLLTVVALAGFCFIRRCRS